MLLKRTYSIYASSVNIYFVCVLICEDNISMDYNFRWQRN